jgi:hypothetical protein
MAEDNVLLGSLNATLARKKAEKYDHILDTELRSWIGTELDIQVCAAVVPLCFVWRYVCNAVCSSGWVYSRAHFMLLKKQANKQTHTHTHTHTQTHTHTYTVG